MIGKGEGRRVRSIKATEGNIFASELSLVSDYLYFEIVFENDYPELAELLEMCGREHAKNIKRMTVAEDHNYRAGGDNVHKQVSVSQVLTALIEKEQGLKLLYERLYLLCDDRELESDIKEILRASEMRLSILKNIQKC